MERSARFDSLPVRSVRTLLVSDVHLGCRHSRPRDFLQFIRGFNPESLYIVGDFIDGWKINSGWFWPRECDEIIDHLVMLVQRGTKVYYTPGNHDSFLRTPAFGSMLPVGFPKVEVADEFVFESLTGWRFLVTHGDLFDFFETKAQWISKRSSFFYDSCLSLNRWFHRWLLAENRNPYGVCTMLKGRVKRGVKFISNYESKISKHATSRNCEGIICGHIHTPDLVHKGPVLYCNTGDWVENCTALVEQHDGQFELVARYAQNRTLTLPDRNGDRPPVSQVPARIAPFDSHAQAESEPKRERIAV